RLHGAARLVEILEVVIWIGVAGLERAALAIIGECQLTAGAELHDPPDRIAILRMLVSDHVILMQAQHLAGGGMALANLRLPIQPMGSEHADDLVNPFAARQL